MSRSGFLLLLLIAAEAGIAQSSGTYPVISNVVGAADYSDSLLGLPRGGIFSIFGVRLAPATARAEDTRVRIWRESAAVTLLAAAPLLYVSPTQINGILPSTIPAGTFYVTVNVAGVESYPFSIAVTNGRFAPFTQDSSGKGPALIQQYGPAGPLLNRFTRGAVPGQVMTIWGTGLGPVSGQDANVVVMVAGLPVIPSYAGPAPGLPGVDQINFTLPANLPSRCFVPMLVQTAGVSSGVVTIAVSAAGGTCESEAGLSTAALGTLENGGIVRGAVLSFTTTTSLGGAVSRQTEAWMAEYDASALSLLLNKDFVPFANGDKVCERRAYEVSRSRQGILLDETGIYGLRQIPGYLSSNCSLSLASAVYQGGDCGDRFTLTGSPPGAAGMFNISGTTPQPRSANLFRILNVDSSNSQMSISWSATALEPNDRLVFHTGSHFDFSGNIFGFTSSINELTCQYEQDHNPLRISSQDLASAFTLVTRLPVTLALTGVTYQSFSPGLSGLDFVLLRARTATSATIATNP